MVQTNQLVKCLVTYSVVSTKLALLNGRCYTIYRLIEWLLSELFGADNYKAILHEYAAGKDSKKLPPAVAIIILPYVPIAVVMSEFLREIKTETKKEPYPKEFLQLNNGTSMEKALSCYIIK